MSQELIEETILSALQAARKLDKEDEKFLELLAGMMAEWIVESGK